MKHRKRKYDSEFKKMIVELYRSGRKAVDIAEEFEMNPNNIHRWNNEYESKGDLSFPGHGKTKLTEEQAEIVRLKKALKEAQLERDILKKAVSIFSKKDDKYFNS